MPKQPLSDETIHQLLATIPSAEDFAEAYAPHPGDISYPYRSRYAQHRLSFPPAIAQHPNRSRIALEGLVTKHTSISALNLNSYYCQQPALAGLPSLAPLRNLRLLNLEQNALTSWGDILALTQLEVLGLKGNQLSTIPAGIDQLKELVGESEALVERGEFTC